MGRQHSFWFESAAERDQEGQKAVCTTKAQHEKSAEVTSAQPTGNKTTTVVLKISRQRLNSARMMSYALNESGLLRTWAAERHMTHGSIVTYSVAPASLQFLRVFAAAFAKHLIVCHMA